MFADTWDSCIKAKALAIQARAFAFIFILFIPKHLTEKRSAPSYLPIPGIGWHEVFIIL